MSMHAKSGGEGPNTSGWAVLSVAMVAVALGASVIGCKHQRTAQAGQGGQAQGKTEAEEAPASEADKAVALVRRRPEVEKWLALFTGPGGTGPKTGGRPAITVDRREGELWVVHAYEIVEDETGGHTATFNWYRVRLATGEVTPEF